MFNESVGQSAAGNIYNGDIDRNDIGDIIKKIDKAYQPSVFDSGLDDELLDTFPIILSEDDFYESLPNNPQWIQIKKGRYFDCRLNVEVKIRWKH